MLIGVTNAHLIRGASDSEKTAQYEQRIQKLEQQLAQARSRSLRRNNYQAAPAPKKVGANSKRQRKRKVSREESSGWLTVEVFSFKFPEFPRVDEAPSSEETLHKASGRLLHIPIAHALSQSVQQGAQVHWLWTRRSAIRRLRLWRGPENCVWRSGRGFSCTGSMQTLQTSDTSRFRLQHPSGGGRRGA